MTTLNRRDFLDRGGRTGLGLAAGAAILANAQSVRATPANDKVTLGLIGAGGRGNALCDGFLAREAIAASPGWPTWTSAGRKRPRLPRPSGRAASRRRRCRTSAPCSTARTSTPW